MQYTRKIDFVKVDALPLTKAQERSSEYDGIVSDFIRSRSGFARINCHGFMLVSVMSGLRSALRRRGVYPRVWCVIRKKRLYLIDSRITGLRNVKPKQSVYRKADGTYSVVKRASLHSRKAKVSDVLDELATRRPSVARTSEGV